tara:strand:- start:470 stop:580 length:111 start_codon:yes stop_codon:yes gene_type:complete
MSLTEPYLKKVPFDVNKITFGGKNLNAKKYCNEKKK